MTLNKTIYIGGIYFLNTIIYFNHKRKKNLLPVNYEINI